jgi:hypothetical protein
MKKTFLFTIMLVSLGFIHSYSQGIPVYPIPSYNVSVNGYANFMENTQSQIIVYPAEKREVDVEVKTPSGSSDCQATAWVYSLDNTTVLGPFAVDCNEPLQVEIDDRAWGVLIDTDEELLVSVWINSIESMIQKGKYQGRIYNHGNE